MLVDWAKLPEVQGMRAGSGRKGICGDKLSAVLVTTAAGTIFDGKTHWHENEQLLIMVSGTCTLKIDDKIFDARPGDLVFFPAGSRHCAIGVGAEGCVYYEIFAPARPDQLPGWVGASVLQFD